MMAEYLEYNYVLKEAYSEERTVYTCAHEGCYFKTEYATGRFATTVPHTCLPIERPQTNELMREGSHVILSLSFDEMLDVILEYGYHIECRYGYFLHNSFIGRPYGTKILNVARTGFVIPLPFNPVLHTESLKRKTQIIFTPDISIILAKTHIRPGWNIVEAGIGSGSLSHALIQAIQPSGTLHNYDTVQDRVLECYKYFDMYCPTVCCSYCVNVFTEGFRGVDSSSYQMVFLDLPAPEKCLAEVYRVLIRSGHLVVFLPCIEYVHTLLAEIYRSGSFYDVDVIKMQYNSYEFDVRTVGAQYLVRGRNICDSKKIKQLMKNPVARTHTGYIVFSRLGSVYE